MENDPSDDHGPSSEEDSSNPPTVQTSDDSERAHDSDEKDQKNLQQKPLKKPDKILPCPRCHSMDTKFCYYNNYNVNQPRHFCKSCQRYWTAGGTMRNVPVGAGRRKNKSSASRYCNVTVSEALQAAGLEGINGVHHHHHQGLNTNGTVLTFGPDATHIGDRRILNMDPGFFTVQENGDDGSSGSTLTTNSTEEMAKTDPQGQIKLTMNGFSPPMPCFQWPYMWNPAVPLQHPFYPLPFYPPPPYWNGAIPWNFPCQISPGSDPSSSTLGKHTRDGELLNQCDQNDKISNTPTVLVPKTLRIDDPDEAAKSSIWTTLGINKGESRSTGGFFNNLTPKKGKEKVHNIDTPALKANPAAFCRSMNFQEGA